MPANDRQVGGSHYNKDGEQHWDRMYRLYGRGYFVGCATKYIERYHLKNGKQDLDKAIHFIEKLRELEYPEPKCTCGSAENPTRIVHLPNCALLNVIVKFCECRSPINMEGYCSICKKPISDNYVVRDTI